MLRAWVGLIGIFGLVIACEKAEAPPALVVDELVWVRVIPKVEAAIERPAVDQGFDTLMNAVAEDPKLLAAGTTLLGELSADPKISAPLESLLAQLTDSPEIQAEVMRLMAEHPEATPDQVGDLVGQRFDEVWSSKPVSEAWASAFNTYLSKMRGRPEAQEVRKLFEGIRAPSIDRARLAKWSKRLEALEGKRLEGRAAQDAYIKHAWSDARIDAFATAMASNTALQRITARAGADLLALPSLRGDLQTASVALLSDAQVRERVLAAMRLFSRQHPPIPEVRVALTELMTTPGLIDASGVLVGRVLANQDVRKIVDRWYAEVRADASIRGELDKFLDGW